MTQTCEEFFLQFGIMVEGIQVVGEMETGGSRTRLQRGMDLPWPLDVGVEMCARLLVPDENGVTLGGRLDKFRVSPSGSQGRFDVIEEKILECLPSARVQEAVFDGNHPTTLKGRCHYGLSEALLTFTLDSRRLCSSRQGVQLAFANRRIAFDFGHTSYVRR